MTLAPALLEILACPQDKGPLLYFDAEQRLYNPRLRRSYRIEGGIPVMLIEEATDVSEQEHTRLIGLAEQTGVKPTFSE